MRKWKAGTEWFIERCRTRNGGLLVHDSTGVSTLGPELRLKIMLGRGPVLDVVGRSSRPEAADVLGLGGAHGHPPLDRLLRALIALRRQIREWCGRKGTPGIHFYAESDGSDVDGEIRQ